MPKIVPQPNSFDAALRRLVQVPKTELDAEEAKYQKMRKRLKVNAAKKAKRKRKN